MSLSVSIEQCVAYSHSPKLTYSVAWSKIGSEHESG